MTPTQCICEKPYIAVGTEHCANCGGYPTEDTPTPQGGLAHDTRFTAKSNQVAALRETLAAIEHERWSDWQLWCHEVIRSNVGKIDRLEDVLARWDRQAITPYEKLSDKEKASDMEQVDRYWWLIEEYVKAAQIQLLSELEKQGGYAHAEALKTGSNQVVTLNAKIEELQQLLEGDRTLGGSLLRVPDHPDDVRVVDVSSEWLADEMNYRPRRAIREWIETRIARYQEQVNDLITTGSSQDTVTPSRPGEHKKQELERGK